MTNDTSIELISFGHHFGVPKHADLLYSVRHLPLVHETNYQPYHHAREMQSQNECVYPPEYEQLTKTIAEQITNFMVDCRKQSLTIAIGCDRGQDQSVAIVEQLAQQLPIYHQIRVNHRDCQRERYNKDKRRKRMTHRDRKYAFILNND
jgi:RNase adaptor protein for sRNA GlmZ degradation